MRIYDLPAVTRLSPTDEFRVSIAEGGYKKISLVDFRTALSIPEIPPVPIFEKWLLNGPLTGWPTEAAAVASLPADGGFGVLDGIRRVGEDCTLAEVRLAQRVGGTGTTEVTLVVRRDSSFLEAATVSVASADPFSEVLVSPLLPLLSGDILFPVLRSAQYGAHDLLLSIKAIP